MENKLVDLIEKKPNKTLKKASKLIYDSVGYLIQVEQGEEIEPYLKVISKEIKDEEPNEYIKLNDILHTLKELTTSLSVHESVLFDHLVKNTERLEIKLKQELKKQDEFPDHIKNYKEGLFSNSDVVRRFIVSPIRSNVYLETYSAINPHKDVPFREIIVAWKKNWPLDIAGPAIGALLYTNKELTKLCFQLSAEKGMYSILLKIKNNLEMIKNIKDIQNKNPEYFG